MSRHAAAPGRVAEARTQPLRRVHPTRRRRRVDPLDVAIVCLTVAALGLAYALAVLYGLVPPPAA